MSPGTSYKYAAKSVSSAGPSDLSSSLTVTTLMPYISGPSTICSQESYTIRNFLTGATAQRGSSGKVILASGQRTSTATYSANGNGIGGVTAVVTYQGRNITLVPFPVSVGVPLRPYINNGVVTQTTTSVSYTLSYGSPTTSLQLFFIEQPGSAHANAWVTQKAVGSDFDLVDNGTFVYVNPTSVGTGSFTVKGQNACGLSSATTVYITINQTDRVPIDPPGLPIDFTLSPNPTSDDITVSISESSITSNGNGNSSESKSYEVQLWNDSQLIETVKTSNQSVKLSTNNLPAGIYYVRVTRKGQSKSRAFVRQ